jgi:hypothetical protein
MDQKGKCMCGAVSYVASQVESGIHACHCSMCRQWSGGPGFSSSVGSVAFEGEANITRYQSSDWAERGFCTKCGCNLFYYLKEANHYIMCVGTFEDQSQFTLTSEIYIEEKPAGYNFAGDHLRQTGDEFLAAMQGD